MQFCIMLTPKNLYEMLEKRRAELGLSQAEVCMRAFGKSDNSPLQSIRRGSSPSVDKLEALCAALDINFQIGSDEQHVAEPNAADQEAEEFHDGMWIPWHSGSRHHGSAPVALSRFWMQNNSLMEGKLRAIELDHSSFPLPMSGEMLAVVDLDAARCGKSDWVVNVDDRKIAASVEFLPDLTLIPGGGKDGRTIVIPSPSLGSDPLIGQIRWLGILARGTSGGVRQPKS
ncbi:hypothetical protein SAMN05421763_103312 [[Luteovulum] sphaeroides subsp. megalophilum]|nr:hypothetical protein SAMN05421763_103312 [[Luteovulum] sphaeroides subsp. megalophilum]